MILVTKQFENSKSNYCISLVFELFRLTISLNLLTVDLADTYNLKIYVKTNKSASKCEKAHPNLFKWFWQH